MPYITCSKAIDDMPQYPGGAVVAFFPGQSVFVHESVRHFYVGNPDFVISETNPDLGDVLVKDQTTGAVSLNPDVGDGFYQKPTGFAWNPPISIWRSGLELKTDFDPQTWMAPAVATLWVSLARGNDTTGTGSFATPYKTIARAITAMTAATTVYIEAGVYDRMNGFKGAVIQHPCNFIAVGGSVVSSARWEGGTWTLTSNGTYSAARSVVKNVVDDADKSDHGVGKRLKQVASQALCEAEHSTWATNGTTVWVHTFNGRAPDSSVLVMLDVANFRLSTDAHVYCRGIELQGGSEGAVRTDTTSMTAASKVIFDKCKMTHSVGNGLSATGIGLVVSNQCMAYGNLSDAFNYHQGSNGVHTKAIEINCTALACGDFASTQDSFNASTAHETCSVVRIGTVGIATKGPIIADVGGAKSWNISCVAKNSTAVINDNSKSGFYATGTAVMFLDGCAASGQLNDVYTDSTAQILVRNSGLTGTGTY